jgi:hypothetical protein
MKSIFVVVIVFVVVIFLVTMLIAMLIAMLLFNSRFVMRVDVNRVELAHKRPHDGDTCDS